MKFAKILICTILMVAILSVPCFATNEGTYGHYITPGVYLFDKNITGWDVNNLLRLSFESNNTSFIGMYFYPDTSVMLYATSIPVADTSIIVYDDGWVSEKYRTITVTEGFYISDSMLYLWWSQNLTRVDSDVSSSLIDSTLSLFAFVGQWISGAAEDLTAMFWLDNSLTFAGTLVIASLAMAVSFLIIGLISRFLRFRG